jgi:two-component system heavy metal sensor histidine kinase CusS
MSLKSVKENLCTALSLVPSTSWSITRRIRTLYALSAAIIFSLASGLLYWGLVNTLKRQSNLYLNDEINVIKTIASKPDGWNLLKTKLETSHAVRKYMMIHARILDQSGRVLLQTNQMGGILPAAIFPAINNDTGDGTITWQVVNSNSYLLRSTRLTNSPGTGQGDLLQIALDLSCFDKILADFRNLLMAAIATGTLLSAWLSALIARKGMRPLQDMAERTRQISTSNLDQRIKIMYCPDELKNLADSFDEMLERLQDSFERLSNHANNMAHELRTPINVLISEAEMALSQERTAQEYRNVIESSLEEYSAVSRMVDSLLFLARADIGQSPLALEEIDACTTIEKIVEYYQPLADDKGITIFCAGDAVVQADPTLFRRAVSNLLSNALHYTPSQGKICIAIRQGNELSTTITFTDTGCGISKEDLPKVFDRFYRAESTKERHVEGTGLGLAIVKSIVKLHGGSCSIDSEQGKGTTVTVVFPSNRQAT